MKKYILVLFLIVFIVPSVALASWWNPFSWFNNWSFHKANTQTQILENRVKELEKKLENTTATSTIEISNPQQATIKPKPVVSTPISSKTAPVEKKTTPIVIQTPVQEISAQTLEYKKILMDKALEVYSNYKASLGYINNMMPFIDERINEINSIIPKNESIANKLTDSYFINFINLTNDLYRSDINICQLDKKQLTGYKEIAERTMDAVNKDIVTINNFKDLSSGSFNQWNGDFIKALETSSVVLKGSQDTVLSYLNSAKKSNENYELVMNKLKNEIDSMSADYSYNNSTTTTISPRLVIPTITPPKIQTCYFTSYNNTYGTSGNISCY